MSEPQREMDFDEKMDDIKDYILKKYFNPKEHRKIIEEAARRAAEDQKRLSKRYRNNFNK